MPFVYLLLKSNIFQFSTSPSQLVFLPKNSDQFLCHGLQFNGPIFRLNEILARFFKEKCEIWEKQISSLSLNISLNITGKFQ